ncbi:MAG: hypothetical protein AUG51_25160 [Acidobacteria bacterium 13_1_20CM_3_53_8]|nr:MAG: hypothetical protein AUG51_25160 [Acidobacteria bacterium 13_1_20CM_3_53_8]
MSTPPTALSPDKNETYDETRLILCEGESDNNFFRKLMQRRSITGFQVIKAAEGKTNFNKSK